MKVLFYVAVVAMELFGICSIFLWRSSGRRSTRHLTSFVAGVCLLAGGMGAYVLDSWWSLLIGFVLSFIAVNLLGSPYRRKNLLQAVKTGDVEEVKSLLSLGSDVNARYDAAMTPLYWAAQEGQTTIVQLLLDHGADVNGSDLLSGWTALHMAAMYGHDSVVELLLNGGANIDATANEGETALDLASEGEHSAVVQILVQRGAKARKVRG